jgi:RimJ/RimL family protein N-acetyltransferase
MIALSLILHLALGAGVLSGVVGTGSLVIMLPVLIAQYGLRTAVGFQSISMVHRNAEVAYDLHPDEWGQGLAKAACRSVVGWAMRQGLTRIQSPVLIGNVPSLRVLERSGLEFQGRLRKYRWVEGVAHDALMYSYLRT